MAARPDTDSTAIFHSLYLNVNGGRVILKSLHFKEMNVSPSPVNCIAFCPTSCGADWTSKQRDS